MLTTGPPEAGGPALRLSRAGRRIFDGSSAAALDPTLRVYLADMVAPYGVALRDDLLDRGCGQSYGEMAGAVLAQTVPPGLPVDLIVLAFAVSDVVPGRATAAHLSFVCPGEPAALAICDQGVAAPYTGLRVLGEYARAGACRRGLLVVVEQATLHHEPAGPALLPARHAAVALLCEAAVVFDPVAADTVLADTVLANTVLANTVRVLPDVAPSRVADVLAAELAVLPGAGPLIAGAGLADVAPQACAMDGVVVAPDGQPCTGVWWELAGRLAGGPAPRYVLADYEPALRYLCVAATGRA